MSIGLDQQGIVLQHLLVVVFVLLPVGFIHPPFGGLVFLQRLQTLLLLFLFFVLFANL